MIKITISCLLISTAVLAGCNERESDVTPSESIKRGIDGYGNLKFGMSMPDIVSLVGPQRFNSYSLKECVEDIATDGCFLSQKSNTTLYEIKDGIPFALQVGFSKFDKLEDVGLVFHRDEGVSGKECVDIFTRAVGWLEQDFGTLVSWEDTAEKEASLQPIVTPEGTKHRVFDGDSGSVMGDGRVNFEDGSGVFILAFGTRTKGKESCMVNIKFSRDITTASTR